MLEELFGAVPPGFGLGLGSWLYCSLGSCALRAVVDEVPRWASRPLLPAPRTKPGATVAAGPDSEEAAPDGSLPINCSASGPGTTSCQLLSSAAGDREA